MKYPLSILLLWCAICGFAAEAVSTEGAKITIEQLQKMFGDMRAKTKWNVDGPLVWGYYFTDPDPKKLQDIADELTKGGYRLVEIHPASDRRWYILHVEKIERHTPDSLNQRNQELYHLAEQHQLRSYDGMDVGPNR